MDILCLASPWVESRKLGPTQGHAAVATCRPFPGRGVTILLVSELEVVNDFSRSESSGYRYFYSSKNCRLNFTFGY